MTKKKRVITNNFINSKVSKDPIWEMAMAFQVSKALFLANNLDIFTILSRKPDTAEATAKKLKLQSRPVERLLNAMSAFGLLKKKDGKYYNTDMSETFLVKGRPEYFGNYLNAINEVYRAWSDYEKVVENNSSIPLFRKDYAEGQEVIHRMMLAQEGFSFRQAAYLPEVYDFSGHRLLLDVGGGTGIFSVMAVNANPNLMSIIFDVPPVCAVARERIKLYKAEKKIKIMEGNFITDNLPQGADAALLSTILDAYDDNDCRHLIKKVFDSLKPGGTIIANEMMLNKEGTGPLFPAIFSLELMIERNRGNSRKIDEIKGWMKDAGFTKIKCRPLWLKGETYLNCWIVTGKKR
ncbi:MAG: hypothetical protein HZA77_09470 [Candidatus Schekmanbacteria bacterium]|nr:hypothetical protein [Candidatus Schekmanbacteria bacterium]